MRNYGMFILTLQEPSRQIIVFKASINYGQKKRLPFQTASLHAANDLSRNGNHLEQFNPSAQCVYSRFTFVEDDAFPGQW